MIEEQARVMAVRGGHAWVETGRRSACGSCSASSGCEASLVARLFGKGTNRLQVADTLGLTVGDRVVIGISEGTLTRASLLAYLVPLVILVAAAVTARSSGAGEGVQALCGILGLGLGIWTAGRLTRGPAGRERFHPALLRRVASRSTLAQITETSTRAS